MKGKQFLMLLVVLAAVAGFGLAVHLRRESAWRAPASAEGGRLFPKLDVNAVEVLRVTDADGAVELRRRNGTWGVAQRDDYPADFEAIQRLLLDVSELKSVREVRASGEQLTRLGLFPPDSKEKGWVLLTLFAANGHEVGRLHFGKEHRPGADEAAPLRRGFASGRYVLVPSRRDVVLVANAFASLVSHPANWLDKEFVRITEIKTARLVEAGKTVWELARDKSTDDLTLAGLAAGEELDGAKAAAVASAFAWAGFADIAGRLQNAAAWGLDNPRIFQATDFDGFDYTIGIGALKDGRHAATVAVSYKGPTERVPGVSESPEDRTKADRVFRTQLEERQGKAAALKQKTDGWVFLLEQTMIQKVLIPRDSLLKGKTGAAAVVLPPATVEKTDVGDGAAGVGQFQ